MEIDSSQGNPGGMALVVRNACKSYQVGQPVLKNLSMTVPTGSIYSLLGSSGCGKTTLLSCCVGLQKLDQGSIKVFGVTPGSRYSGIPGNKVGYMPQELSLHNEFSIEECLHHFGRLNGMSSQKIVKNTEFLIDLLKLPDGQRRIHTLSGGQKRRASFALGVFNAAPLLILDEPTVGVDAILRETIWNYLRQLVTCHKSTVIITTHYTEETRFSETVGIMRNGRLLVEASPEALLESFNATLLEQVVLTISKIDEENEYGSNADNATPQIQGNIDLNWDKNENPVEIIKFQRHSPDDVANSAKISNFFAPQKDVNDVTRSVVKRAESFIGNAHKDFSAKFSRLHALIFKNFLILLRNYWFLLFVFLVPSMQIVIICLAIGPDPKHMPFGIVNHELAQPNFLNLSSEFDGVGCPLFDRDSGSDCGLLLSCQYIQLLPKDIVSPLPFSDAISAREAVRSGHIWGFFEFPTNYSSYLVDRAASGAYAENATFDGSRISFEMDMSNQQIGQTLKKVFFQVYEDFVTEVSLDCGANPRQSELPLEFKKPIYGSDGTSFSEFLAPSVFLGLMFFFPLCSSGISYISEKKSGTLARSFVSGVTTSETMIAYLVSQLVVLIGQSGLAFFILNLVFKIPILGSIPLALLLAILIGLAGMSMGFLISTICSEEIHAVLLAIGSFFPNFLLAGMVWPIQGMPVILQWISFALPCTLACESMRSIVSRGWGITHRNVWPGFLSTAAWISVYWTLTILIHQLRNRS